MRPRSGIPVLALALAVFSPVRGDDGPAAKAPAATSDKSGEAKKKDSTSCCAGDEKAKCPREKASAPKKTAAKTAPAPSPKAAKPEAAGTANMVVTRDPETGEIRNATPAERERLLGRRPQVAPAPPRVVVLPDGTEMVELGEDSMSYAVARRNPDGTMTQSCAEGPEAAAAARKPKAEAPAPRDVR